MLFIQGQERLRRQFVRMSGSSQRQWNPAKAGILGRNVRTYIQIQRHTHHLRACGAGKLDAVSIQLQRSFLAGAM